MNRQAAIAGMLSRRGGIQSLRQPSSHASPRFPSRRALSQQRFALAVLRVDATTNTPSPISDDIGYTAVGLRIVIDTTLPNGITATPYARMAWQHAFGELTPETRLRFANKARDQAVQASLAISF